MFVNDFFQIEIKFKKKNAILAFAFASKIKRQLDSISRKICPYPKLIGRKRSRHKLQSFPASG